MRFDELPNESQQPGALVRVAGSVIGVQAEAAFEAGARAAAMTHGAAEAYLAGGLAASVIAELLIGTHFDEAVRRASSIATRWPGGDEVVAHVDAGSTVGMPAAIRVINESLALARTTTDGLQAYKTAARHSTATAVLTAQFVGAAKGARSLPADWRSAVDAVAILEEMADAASLAHRTWLLLELLPARLDDDPADESPLGTFLWPRFPGY
jgi:hypothetical protein